MADIVNPFNEQDFQDWYQGQAGDLGLNPDPDAPGQDYDYRSAYMLGFGPDASGHWPSTAKQAGNDRLNLSTWDAGWTPGTWPHEEMRNTATGLPSPVSLRDLMQWQAPDAWLSPPRGQIGSSDSPKFPFLSPTRALPLPGQENANLGGVDAGSLGFQDTSVDDYGRNLRLPYSNANLYSDDWTAQEPRVGDPNAPENRAELRNPRTLSETPGFNIPYPASYRDMAINPQSAEEMLGMYGPPTAPVGGMVNWFGREIPNMYLFRGMRNAAEEVPWLEKFMEMAQRGKVVGTTDQSTSPLAPRDIRRAAPEGVVYHGNAEEWPATGIADIYSWYDRGDPLFRGVNQEAADKAMARMQYLRALPEQQAKIDILGNPPELGQTLERQKTAVFSEGRPFHLTGNPIINDAWWQKFEPSNAFGNAWELNNPTPADYVRLPLEARLKVAQAAGYDNPELAKYAVDFWDKWALQNIQSGGGILAVERPNLFEAMRTTRPDNPALAKFEGPFSLYSPDMWKWERYGQAINKLQEMAEPGDASALARTFGGASREDLMVDPAEITPEQYFMMRRDRFSDPTVGKPSGAYGEVVHQLGPDVNQKIAGVVVDPDNPHPDLLKLAEKHGLQIFKLPYQAIVDEPKMGQLSALPPEQLGQVKDLYLSLLGNDLTPGHKQLLWDKLMASLETPGRYETPLKNVSLTLKKAFNETVGIDTPNPRQPFVDMMGLGSTPTYQDLANLSSGQKQILWDEFMRGIPEQYRADADLAYRQTVFGSLRDEMANRKILDNLRLPYLKAAGMDPLSGDWITQRATIKRPLPDVADILESKDPRLRKMVVDEGKMMIGREDMPESELMQLMRSRPDYVHDVVERLRQRGMGHLPEEKDLMTSSEIPKGVNWKYRGQDFAWE